LVRCRRPRALHRRLATLVRDEEEVARHLAQAADEPNAAVAEALERAAARAPGARRQWRRRRALRAGGSLDATGPDERRSPAGRWRRLGTGSRRAVLREREMLEAALESLPAGRLRAEALATLGRLEQFGGDQPQAIERFRCALAETDDEAVPADSATGRAATLFFMREDLGEALRHAELGAELALRTGDRARYVNALGFRGLVEGVLGRCEARRRWRPSRLWAARLSG
jgi:hypothetical protein